MVNNCICVVFAIHVELSMLHCYKLFFYKRPGTIFELVILHHNCSVAKLCCAHYQQFLVRLNCH